MECWSVFQHLWHLGKDFPSYYISSMCLYNQQIEITQIMKKNKNKNKWQWQTTVTHSQAEAKQMPEPCAPACTFEQSQCGIVVCIFNMCNTLSVSQGVFVGGFCAILAWSEKLYEGGFGLSLALDWLQDFCHLHPQCQAKLCWMQSHCLLLQLHLLPSLEPLSHRQLYL